MTLKEVLDAAGRAHVLDVLASTGGNITEAAKVLGISRKNLWEYRQRYKIPAGAGKPQPATSSPRPLDRDTVDP